MVQEVNTIQDVTAFIEHLATEIGDYNPFADFNDFINPVTNQPIYTDEEAALRKRLLDECFVVCGQQHSNFIYLFIVVLQESRDNIAHLQSQITTLHNRQRKDYFKGCSTVVGVKARYLQLADEYNFYRGGDVKTMERINEEYAKVCDPIIMHSATSEENMFAQFDLMAGYVEIVSLLRVLTGIKVEIIDTYLWVTCTVYESEKTVKAAGFKFSAGMQAWCYPL